MEVSAIDSDGPSLNGNMHMLVDRQRGTVLAFEISAPKTGAKDDIEDR